MPMHYGNVEQYSNQKYVMLYVLEGLAKSHYDFNTKSKESLSIVSANLNQVSIMKQWCLYTAPVSCTGDIISRSKT